MPVPVTVIGGFLGAGKTTLLNRWLGQAPSGQPLGVLVNDFGALNIDAALVADRGARSLALSNGCVCCSIGDDLGQALAEVLAARPAVHAIVIETSGVADPWRVAQVALADPQLALQAVVVLVDSAALLQQAADPLLTSSLVQPLRHADLVLLNKADRVDAAQLDRVRHWVAGHCGPAGAPPMLATTQADLPWTALAEAVPPRDEPAQPDATGQPWPVRSLLDAHHARQAAQASALAHDQRFEQAHWQPEAVFDEARLRGWLRALPPGVLRMKGLLRSSRRGWVVLQWAGRQGALRAARPAQVQARGRRRPGGHRPGRPAARGGAGARPGGLHRRQSRSAGQRVARRPHRPARSAHRPSQPRSHTMSTGDLQIHPLGPAIGALVSGVQLSDGLHEPQRDALLAALLKHHVLFFEHQSLQPAAQKALAARFGDLHIHPVYPQAPGVPEIIVLDTSHDNPPDNDNWHTDVTFLAAPAMGAILSAQVLPPSGGDTLWASGIAAWQALSPRWQAMLAGLQAEHDFLKSFPAHRFARTPEERVALGEGAPGPPAPPAPGGAHPPGVGGAGPVRQ